MSCRSRAEPPANGGELEPCPCFVHLRPPLRPKLYDHHQEAETLTIDHIRSRYHNVAVCEYIFLVDIVLNFAHNAYIPGPRTSFQLRQATRQEIATTPFFIPLSIADFAGTASSSRHLPCPCTAFDELPYPSGLPLSGYICPMQSAHWPTHLPASFVQLGPRLHALAPGSKGPSQGDTRLSQHNH